MASKALNWVELANKTNLAVNLSSNGIKTSLAYNVKVKHGQTPHQLTNIRIYPWAHITPRNLITYPAVPCYFELDEIKDWVDMLRRTGTNVGVNTYLKKTYPPGNLYQLIYLNTGKANLPPFMHPDPYFKREGASHALLGKTYTHKYGSSAWADDLSQAELDDILSEQYCCDD